MYKRQGVEQEIETFKKQNQITNVSEQARILMENSSNYYKELTEKQVQLNVLKTLEKFVFDESKRIIPSNLVVSDASLVELVNSYNRLQLDRDRLLIGSTNNNPQVILINKSLKFADIVNDLYKTIEIKNN